MCCIKKTFLKYYHRFPFREAVTTFFLDPSTDPSVIQLVQLNGPEPVLTPLFQAARAWVWSAHRARMRMLGLEYFLK